MTAKYVQKLYKNNPKIHQNEHKTHTKKKAILFCHILGIYGPKKSK